MSKRIAITGPECSGKSTLAGFLAKEFDGHLVNEYAREYLSNLNRSYNAEDVEKIAKKQFELNNQFNRKMIISDTEMLVAKIWHQEKFNSSSKIIDELVNQQHFDFYFLCMPDLPWEYDALRENPDDRHRIFIIYKDLIESLYPKNHIIIKGTGENREKKALEIFRDFG